MIDPMIAPLHLSAAPLTPAVFAPFGEVIEGIDGNDGRIINQGTGRRRDGVAALDLLRSGGVPRCSVVRAMPQSFPVRLRAMERHPLASQLFLPIGEARFLAVVARAGPPFGIDSLAAFLTDGRQGLNYRAGTWHHPLIALDRQADFLVIDRAPELDNLEEISLADSEPLDVIGFG